MHVTEICMELKIYMGLMMGMKLDMGHFFERIFPFPKICF